MQKLNEFGAQSYEEWLKLVARDLNGAPFEKKLVKRVAGIDIKPLYTKADADQTPAPGLPGFAPFTRGTSALGGAEMGWDVRAEAHHSSPDEASSAIAEDLAGEASSLLLMLDDSGCGEREGVAIRNLADLDKVLAHVALDKTPIALHAGGSALPAAALLIAIAKKRNVPLKALSGSFGADPIGTLSESGMLPTSMEGALLEMSALAKWARDNAPGVRAVTVNVSPYHDAGADAATEIAVALGTAVHYLRALTAEGLSVAEAAKQLVFRFSVGRDFFVEIAKLRAARACFAKVVAACGGDEDAQAMVIHAYTSWRSKTQRDPWVNLLRATAESFSAAVGGADIITTVGFDRALGDSDELARRMARNTQHLLRHESHVHRVVDPAGGSWYVEQITDALARRAWTKFSALEKSGGVFEALQSGTLQKELSAALETERKAVETRKLAITGVNEFPNVREEAVVRTKVDPASQRRELESARAAGTAALSALSLKPGAPLEGAIDALSRGAALVDVRAALRSESPATVAKVHRARLSEAFESLRDLADASALKRGRRPRVFLANLGPIPAHKARATFAQNFFEAGGIEALTNDGFANAQEAADAFKKSQADIVVLCSSDEVYQTMASDTAKALRALGAKAIVLAGSPGEHEASYREAGVTDFVFMGANVFESLRSLLERVGVQ